MEVGPGRLVCVSKSKIRANQQKRDVWGGDDVKCYNWGNSGEMDGLSPPISAQ